MISCSGRFGVRLEGDKAVTWFVDRAKAERYEFDRLWAPAIRRAQLLGKRIILPANVARMAEQFRDEV